MASQSKMASIASNTFSVLSSILKERALTEALRFLLDSSEPHHLGDKFFREFVNLIGRNHLIPHEPSITTATGQWFTDERKIVDVLVVARKSWADSPYMVIGIEGKINSPERDKQISDYQSALSRSFKGPISRVVVYLTTSKAKSITANKRLKSCPCLELGWKDIADISRKIDLAFCRELSDYIQQYLLIDQATGPDAQYVTSFFEDRVLREIRRRLKAPESELSIAWHYPPSKPNEFNFNHREINSLLPQDRLQIYYMFYCPQGVFAPGRRAHLLIMARPYDEFRKRKDTQMIQKLKQYMPGREGCLFEWDVWTFIWSAGWVTLTDLGDEDCKNLCSLYEGAYSRTSKHLKRAIKKLWK